MAESRLCKLFVFCQGPLFSGGIKTDMPVKTPSFTFTVVLALSVMLSSANSLFAEAEVIWQEDFEQCGIKEPPVGWKVSVPEGAGEIQVLRKPGRQGDPTRCLCLRDVSSRYQLSAETEFSPQSDTLAVEHDTMIDAQTNQACTCLYVQRAVCLAFMSDALKYFDGPSPKEICRYVPGRWYRVKYLIDPKTQSFALYLDDRLIAANIKFRRPADELSSLQCETGQTHCQGVLHLDNIVVRRLTPTEADLLQGTKLQEERRVEQLRQEYKWLDVAQLEVPEDWGTDAWYRRAAKNISYDLSVGIKLDDTHPAKGHAILLADGAGTVERFAAEELQKYLFRITGLCVPITNKFDSRQRLVIHVGNQLDRRLEDCCEDSFVVVGQGGRLTLSGAGDRGTLYSVYHFLEKHLGCRWYFPDPHEGVIPRLNLKRVDAVIARGVDDFEQPAMKYRSLMILNTDACIESPAWNPDWKPLGTQVGRDDERRWLRNQLVRTVYQIDWMAKNRYNAVVTEGSWGGMHIFVENWDLIRTIFPEIKKRGLRLGLGGHFWTPFLNDDMPNWPADNSWGAFSNGKHRAVELCGRVFFCTTDHDALRTFLRHVVSFFRANPEFDIWAVWPPDTSHGCQCSVCSLFSMPYRCVKVHNQIAEAIECEAARAASPIHGRTIPVILIAYSSSKVPPEQGLRLHPNLAIMPDIYRQFSKPYVAGPADAWKSFLRTHGQNNDLVLFGRFCRSFLTGYHLLAPSMIPETVRNLIDDGFCGVELFHGCGGWWVKGLWQYAASKAMWNPDVEMRSLEDDFFRHYYGLAAGQMRTFYEANEQAQADNPRNYDYGSNYDVCAWWQMRKCPRINPDWDGDYLPDTPKVTEKMLALSATAERCFAEAADLACDAPNREKLLKRINKAKLSWEYYRNQKLNEKYQFEGLKFMEHAYANCQNLREYLVALSEAQRQFERAQACFLYQLQLVQQHTLLHNDFSVDEGAFWDGGVILYDRSVQWLEIIEQLREKAQADGSASFPDKRLWQVRYDQGSLPR